MRIAVALGGAVMVAAWVLCSTAARFSRCGDGSMEASMTTRKLVDDALRYYELAIDAPVKSRAKPALEDTGWVPLEAACTTHHRGLVATLRRRCGCGDQRGPLHDPATVRWDHPTWRVLDHHMVEPFAWSYRFIPMPDGFVVAARAALGCDGRVEFLSRRVRIPNSGNVVVDEVSRGPISDGR